MDHPVVRAEVRLKPEHRPTGIDFRHTNVCVTWSSGLGGGGHRDMIFLAMNHRGFGDDGQAMPGSLSCSIFEAFSSGEVRLRSADPHVDPFVEENMLGDERDLVRMRDGFTRQVAMLRQPAFASVAESIAFGLTQTKLEDAAKLQGSDLDTLLVAETTDAQHAAGTCRMGRVGDPAAVVDSQCRVQGLENLRVVDASVMPADCRANTHLTTVMIGEKTAASMRAELS
jgi:choline dehydrogenase